MHTLILMVAVEIGLNLIALFLHARIKTLICWNIVLSVLLLVFCLLKGNFNLGPHIEVHGWIAGSLLAGITIFLAIVAVGIHKLTKP